MSRLILDLIERGECVNVSIDVLCIKIGVKTVEPLRAQYDGPLRSVD